MDIDDALGVTAGIILIIAIIAIGPLALIWALNVLGSSIGLVIEYGLIEWLAGFVIILTFGKPGKRK